METKHKWGFDVHSLGTGIDVLSLLTLNNKQINQITNPSNNKIKITNKFK